jgi:hypothetical protein
MYIRVTLYCEHLIIYWLFNLGISCTAFVLICTVVVLYCFVMCMCVCMCGFCNVCVCDCVGFVMRRYFGNMYTVLWLKFFLTWLRIFLPWQDFPCSFLSCKANDRVKLAKTGHGPYSSTLVVMCCSVVICVVLCIVYV